MASIHRRQAKKTEKCLASECGKRRISANQDELKIPVISENQNTPETSITAIKRSYRPDQASAQGLPDTLEARGFESQAENTYPLINKELTDTQKTCLAYSLAALLQDHPELANLIDFWPKLPDHVKLAIQTLIQSCIR